MKKGIAIPYIIALILGIIVVALLGYWFFVLGGGFAGKNSLTQCQTDFDIYCRGLSASGYDIRSYGDFTDICDRTTDSPGDYKSPGCCAYNYDLLNGKTSWTDACKVVLGQPL